VSSDRRALGPSACARMSMGPKLPSRTIRTYRRWVEGILRFHRDRTGRWIHPKEIGELEVEAFLTHRAVNRRVAESTQKQTLGAILCHAGRTAFDVAVIFTNGGGMRFRGKKHARFVHSATVP
jgi:hypothetical protein